jgi:pimeloyl-ACP methyl ester carboxylesterase
MPSPVSPSRTPTWITLARRLGIACVALYAGSALFMVLAEEVLLRWHDRTGVVRGSGTDLWLRTEDGVRLHARYHARDPAAPTLLYLHGGAGNLASRSDRLELFADLGANLLALEYRSYGLSEGAAASELGLQRDTEAAYAWLRQRTPASKIIPFGESMGGGFAAWLAATHEVGGLILLSTSTSTPALFESFMPWLPTRWLVRTRLETVTRIERVSVPKLLIHSRSDEVVPFRMAEALWTAAPAPKQKLWLDGVGHNETFYQARGEAVAALRGFLSSLPP